MWAMGDTEEKVLKVMKKLWFCVSLAVLLIFIGSSQTEAYGFGRGPGRNQAKEDIGSATRNKGIAFNNNLVEVGVPLIVTGASDGASYQWAITSADGTVNSFQTKENSYIPTEADMEKLITVTVEGMEDSEAVIYYSALPVIYINNSTGYYSVGDEYSDAVMEFQGHADYSEEGQLYNGDIQVRLRGNSTKWREKKPFNIKLGEKTDLLGMGKSKHWALLANDIDHTLMRNKLLYDFSGDIGMKPYSKSENVIVIFNNRYYGVYQLCETVNIEPERVDIFDWEECAEDAATAIVASLAEKDEIAKPDEPELRRVIEDTMCQDLSWVTKPYTVSYDLNSDGSLETYTITDYVDLPDPTGGVLLEMDFYAFDNHNPSTMVTKYAQPIYFKSPEYAISNPVLFNKIQKYLQSFEYALHSPDFIYHENDRKYESASRYGGNEDHGYTQVEFSAPDYDGKHYTELFDMESLIQNFLVCELSMNWDSMKNSVFYYKDTDDLFHIGPEWDFDWAWGNINMYNIDTWYPTSWHTTENAFTIEQYYQTVQWNRYLIRDPYFLVRVYEKYKEIRSTVIEDMIKEGGKMDSMEDHLASAAAANDARWNDTYSQYRSVGFEGSMTNMREFIGTRINWLDQQFASLDKLITSLGYYSVDAGLSVTRIDTESLTASTEITAIVTDDDVRYVTFQLNGTHSYTVEVVEGTAVCQIPEEVLIQDETVLNVIEIIAKDASDEYIIQSAEEGNYVVPKSNYAVFYHNAGIINPSASLNGDAAVDADKQVDLDRDQASGSDQSAPDVTVQSQDAQPGRSQEVSSIILIVTIGVGLLLLSAGVLITIRNRRREV